MCTRFVTPPVRHKINIVLVSLLNEVSHFFYPIHPICSYSRTHANVAKKKKTEGKLSHSLDTPAHSTLLHSTPLPHSFMRTMRTKSIKGQTKEVLGAPTTLSPAPTALDVDGNDHYRVTTTKLTLLSPEPTLPSTSLHTIASLFRLPHVPTLGPGRRLTFTSLTGALPKVPPSIPQAPTVF